MEIIPKFDFFVVICDEIVAKYTHKLVRITGRPYIEPDQNIFNRYSQYGILVTAMRHKLLTLEKPGIVMEKDADKNPVEPEMTGGPVPT